MERWDSDPGATRFWYAVTFLAGLCWGISLLIGNFNELFIFFGPPILCLGAAVRLVGRIQAQIIGEALNLFAIFAIGVGIGGALELTGAIQFFRDRLRFF